MVSAETLPREPEMRLARPEARPRRVAERGATVVPRVGSRPVSEVVTADMLEILEPSGTPGRRRPLTLAP